MADLSELLATLQMATVEELLKKVRSGEATATDLNVARALLKDNNITSVPVPGSPLDALTQSLPFTGDDDTSPYAN